jgi:aminopeptidase N
MSDPNSFSNVHQLTTTHAKLDWKVDFERHVISGTVEYAIKSTLPVSASSLILDSRDLKVI